MKRAFIHRLATILESHGIGVFEENISSSMVWRLVFSVVVVGSAMLSVIMFSVENYENLSQLAISLITASAFATYLGGTLVLFQHRQLVSRMLYQMDDSIHRYHDQFDVPCKWYLREETFETFMSAVLIFHYIAIIFITLPGMYELTFFGKIIHYPFPCWTPWDREDAKMQVLALMLELGQAFVAGRLNALVTITAGMVVFEFLRQYERLRVAVCTLDERSKFSVSSSNRSKKLIKIPDEVLDEKVRGNVIECIQHYQLLHQNFLLFKTWFQAFFSFELAITMFSFSLGFYVIFEALTEEMALFTGLACVLTLNVLCRCYIGEIFSNLNNEMKNQIFYETQFWKMGTKNRRLLSMFHFLLDQPFTLNGFSIFGATLSTFGSIVRKAYSVFNVLNVSLNK